MVAPAPAASRNLEIWKYGNLEIWNSGNLEIWKSWNLEIWEVGIQKINKMKIPKIKICVARNVRNVWIGKEKTPGAFAYHFKQFLHVPEKIESISSFRIFLLVNRFWSLAAIHPWWVCMHFAVLLCPSQHTFC